MTQFSGEYYALTHADDTGLNGMERFVFGAVIGFGSASLIVSLLGLVIHWVVTWT